MRGGTWTFAGDVWLHPGEAGWHFVTLPDEVADDVRARTAGAGRAFGRVPAEVTLGDTTWTTSLWADARSGSYLLPLKAAVLARERVAVGDTVAVAVALRG